MPLVRRDARLVPATWPEAVEEAAARLAGSRSPALFAVGPSIANEDAVEASCLARHLGGRLAVTDLSGASAARIAFRQVLARPYGLSDPDAIDSADVVWVFGSDTGECPQAASRVARARRAGASVAYFDVHVPAGEGWQVVTLAPGRFGEIALDLQRAAIEADLVPPEVRCHPGFHDLRRTFGATPFDRMEPARRERGLTLARQWRAAKCPVALLGGRWLTSANAEWQTRALLQAIALLGGSADAIVAAVGEASTWGVLDAFGPDVVSSAELALRDEDLDAAVIVGDDVVRRSPRPAKTAERLSRLDTVVVMDRFLSDTTPFAHVVLPSCGFGEADGSVTNLFGAVQRWRRAVAPPGACEPERVWMSRIGARLGAAVADHAAAPPQPDEDAPMDLSHAGSEPPAVLGAGENEGFHFDLVLGAQPANWSTGVIGQRDEILRREVVESTLAASPSALKEAGLKAGWPAKVTVPDGEATVTLRSDSRLPAGVVVLTPLAGSPAAALRGCHPGTLGRTVGLQPVPARIEPV